jgi:hypothetical protein
MLTGATQSTTGSIGQRKTPTHSTVTNATASGPSLAEPLGSSLRPVAKVRPIAAAAMPLRTPWIAELHPIRIGYRESHHDK